MFTGHHRLDVAGPYPQPAGQMHPEAQAVDQRAGGEDPVMAGQVPGEIGERVGRVGHDHQHRLRRPW